MSDQPGHWCIDIPLIGEKCFGTQGLFESARDLLTDGGNGRPDSGPGHYTADHPWHPPHAIDEGISNGGKSPQTVAGCAVTLPIRMTQRAVCPPGYVVVHPPGEGKQCMLKSVAISCKLYKSPAKPPIKASDWRCLKRSAAVVRRLDTIAKMANRVTGKANLSRSRGKR
jgi:hypothetical protein